MKKTQWLLIGITGIFFCLLVGIFVGRNLTGAYVPLDIAINHEKESTNGQEPSYDGKIDINTATLQQLQMLPGIGESLAQRILDYRTEHGDFATVEQLTEVSGIGPSKLEDMKPYIKAVTKDGE